MHTRSNRALRKSEIAGDPIHSPLMGGRSSNRALDS